MTNTSISFEEIKKKKTVKVKGAEVLKTKSSYPRFKPASREKAQLDAVGRINKFYSSSAEKYLLSPKSKIVKKAAALYEKNKKCNAVVMSVSVSYCDNAYISAFTDVSVFDGKKSLTKRLSQLWDAKKGVLLPPSHVFTISRRTSAYVKEIITEIANKNIQNRSFTYFDNYKAIIKKKFSFSNYYFVPNGVAFYFNAGILSENNYPIVFAVPFERIDGVMKISMHEANMNRL